MDYDANEANFQAQGKLREGALEPSRTEIFEGQRIFLTGNIDKANDFVNGMSAVIENFDPGSMCLHATTATGRPLPVHLCTEDIENHGRVTSFPVRLGYACTIPKVQGATLRHITIWLDRALVAPQPTLPCHAWSAMRTIWWQGMWVRSTLSRRSQGAACNKTARPSAEQLVQFRLKEPPDVSNVRRNAAPIGNKSSLDRFAHAREIPGSKAFAPGDKPFSSASTWILDGSAPCAARRPSKLPWHLAMDRTSHRGCCDSRTQTRLLSNWQLVALIGSTAPN